MIFSKACEYGIKATLYIAKRSLKGERVSLKEIAREIESPEAFTAKILQQLARDEVVVSIKGPKGGFDITKKEMKRIKLVDIVKSIDGEEVFVTCGLGLNKCSAEKPCPVHDQFVEIRTNMERMLNSTSLWEFATQLDDGATFLKS